MIRVSDKMYIPLSEISEKAIEKIKSDLTVPNKDYENALRYSKYGRVNLPKNIYLYKCSKTDLIVPRGYGISKAKNYTDETLETRIDYPKPLITLRELQSIAEKNYLQNTDNGLIILNTAIGKSILGLHLAYMLRQKTLVIVHKNDLIVGWQEDSKVIFGDKCKTGLIKAKKFEIGEQITLATIQTLNRLNKETLNTLYNTFGCIICDEVHHAGAKNYDIINNFKGTYRIGLTATLERADNLDKKIYAMFGGVAIKHKVKKSEDILPVNVTMKPTTLRHIPKCAYVGRKMKHISYKDYGKYKQLIPINKLEYSERPVLNHHDIDNFVVTNKEFIKQVMNDIKKEVKLGHKCIVAFNKKDHIDLYAECLKDLGIECYKYYGDSKDKRDIMLQRAEEVPVTLATYSIATEGTNVKSWQTLFIVSSINNGKNTEQIVGRIRRTDGIKEVAYVYDYYHPHVYGVSRHHETRMKRYAQLGLKIKMGGN